MQMYKAPVKKRGLEGYWVFVPDSADDKATQTAVLALGASLLFSGELFSQQG